MVKMAILRVIAVAQTLRGGTGRLSGHLLCQAAIGPPTSILGPVVSTPATVTTPTVPCVSSLPAFKIAFLL